MSCQSLTTPPARAFTAPDKENATHCGSYHRSVRFSSESRASTRASSEAECRRETPGAMSLTALSLGPSAHPGPAMSQSAPPPSATFDLDLMAPSPASEASCRFPKLEECAHFHYERVALGGVRVEPAPCAGSACAAHGAADDDDGWICLRVRSHVNTPPAGDAGDAAVCEWNLTRNAHNFLQLDEMLHRCIYDRKVSGLVELSAALAGARGRSAYARLVADYVHHLSIIADDSINCGPILNWLQMDNKGHKLLVANEDSSSINTPAVAAAYSVRKYVSQARDEISFEVGDMISIIDMPGPQESVWWRGKRGFRVGFFPHHCVAVIGDKVPRHMTQPPPIVGSVAVAPIKPVLRKHGKLISLFRSFILSRPSRRRLKQQGILRERVFGCDLGEHLLNCGHDGAVRAVPQVLVECARVIESRGAVDGIYRLSGGSGLTQRLRAAFDSAQEAEPGASPAADPAVATDPHALASLLKMYFRELPNPLCTYQLYDSFVRAVQAGPDEAARLRSMRDTVVKLPPPHYRTLSYLMRHLRRVSLLGARTGMTARNMAIVWAPNLLRSPTNQHALQGVAVQAVVTEFLICYAEELFSAEQGAEAEAEPEPAPAVELRAQPDHARRPKSLPVNQPTKLLSLEEARRRGRSAAPPPAVPPAALPAAPLASVADVQLRPSGSFRPKYIEVGSGPNNLPQYHTVLDLPGPGKRGLKRSPSGWRGLFSRSKLQRPRAAPPAAPDHPPHAQEARGGAGAVAGVRPAKSCESLQSEAEPDALAPLALRAAAALRSHARSASCDSYFEPWQTELADMRLRLSPQERDGNIFSEEDDITLNVTNGLPGGSACSSPAASAASAAPAADRKRSKIEEQLSSIGYIDSTESPVRVKPGAEKRHSDEWPTQPSQPDDAKRLCKDRESPLSYLMDLPTSLVAVKLRERSSPRKCRSNRYSGMHQPLNLEESTLAPSGQPRSSWHGVKEHSTLIRIDWPVDNVNSSPLTPYENSESENKRTITIKECDSCDRDKCLKCELNECTDYDVKVDFKVGEPVTLFGDDHDSLESPLPTEVSYQNLNRLSALSTNSSGSEPRCPRADKRTSVMTSSHESSSSYSNISPLKPGDELYDCYALARPNYINLQSSSTSKSSTSSPLKSPLRSTISITFKSPTKSAGNDYENVMTPTNADRDSVYEDVDLAKNLSIVEEASVPETDASLPTQQACQPDSFNEDLIILETPTEERERDGQRSDQIDIYSQVKFFRKSVDEVNALVLEPEKGEVQVSNHYENIDFPDLRRPDGGGVKEICDRDERVGYHDGTRLESDAKARTDLECDNGNTVKAVTKNLNVKQLANKFESPTEQKGPFSFEKYKSTLERGKDEARNAKKDNAAKSPPPISPKTYKLFKNSVNARSLDENAFVKEFGQNDRYTDRRKSLEVRDVRKQAKFTPDLNLNLEEDVKAIEDITPTTENKISLIQRFDDEPRAGLKSLINIEGEKLSRERIEKYKEERRNFLREKYSSQSFRSNPEQLSRLRLRKESPKTEVECERLGEELPKFERRNTVDLGSRMRFSLAKSANNLDAIKSPLELEELDVECKKVEEGSRKCDSVPRSGQYDRKEKVSPSFKIKDMTAMFEQKSQTNTGTG